MAPRPPLLLLLCLLLPLPLGQAARRYSRQWAVHVEGGPAAADAVAAKHGFRNLGQIFADVYHFQHSAVVKRAAEPSLDHHNSLLAERQVKWAQQQVVLSRRKRDLLALGPGPPPPQPLQPAGRHERQGPPQPLQTAGRHERQGPPQPLQTAGRYLRQGAARPAQPAVPLDDPRWPQMWYLNRGHGLDMNVQAAWLEGVTGRDVVVTILDDGLEYEHPDLHKNYDPQASYDVNNHDEDPTPRYDLIDTNRHGTRCAGEVAAVANNSECAVGVAFHARVGGVRMLDGDVTDAVEARSLSLNPQHIDIYSASWGPDDDGKTVDGPGELATRAFIEGVTKGRGGKGSIFVWASGNGGRDHDNCNCDGYTNSIWTLSISSATENGVVPWYSEACSSTLATTYSSGASSEKQVVTTDLHHQCTSSHTGTSASAPLAAGICALALQANRELTWRDMQHIVVRTARPHHLRAPDWRTNGVGRNVSHSFGYGLMDAAAMVRLARSWKTVPEQRRCEVSAPHADKLIPAKSQVTLELYVKECAGVNFLEHVQAKISLVSSRRGDLTIQLTSPLGTRATLLARRPQDVSRAGFQDWPFMSVHTWGEPPFGRWTLEIHNEGRFLGRANLQEWALVFYGTAEPPDGALPPPGPAGAAGAAGPAGPPSGGGAQRGGPQGASPAAARPPLAATPAPPPRARPKVKKQNFRGGNRTGAARGRPTTATAAAASTVASPAAAPAAVPGPAATRGSPPPAPSVLRGDVTILLQPAAHEPLGRPRMPDAFRKYSKLNVLVMQQPPQPVGPAAAPVAELSRDHTLRLPPAQGRGPATGSVSAWQLVLHGTAQPAQPADADAAGAATPPQAPTPAPATAAPRTRPPPPPPPPPGPAAGDGEQPQQQRWPARPPPAAAPASAPSDAASGDAASSSASASGCVSPAKNGHGCLGLCLAAALAAAAATGVFQPRTILL